MLKELFLSESVLALAGGLALAQAPTAGGPVAVPPSSLSAMRLLASDIYKADVYENSESKIGDVTDLVLNSNGNITTAVIGVGGFLGVGQTDIAAPFKDLKITSRNGKDWLVLNRTKEDLQFAMHLRFRHHLWHFDTSSAVRFPSPPRTDGISSRLFSPQSLLTIAACSGLRPAPDCRPRGAFSHLLYSATPSFPEAVFVTHRQYARWCRAGASTPEAC